MTLHVADATICVSKCQTQTPTFRLGRASQDMAPKVWQGSCKNRTLRFTTITYCHLLLSACISQSCPFFCLLQLVFASATPATATQQEEAIIYCHDPSSHKVHRVMQCFTTTNKMSKDVIDLQIKWTCSPSYSVIRSQWFRVRLKSIRISTGGIWQRGNSA